jgi:hypothetical protein
MIVAIIECFLGIRRLFKHNKYDQMKSYERSTSNSAMFSNTSPTRLIDTESGLNAAKPLHSANFSCKYTKSPSRKHSKKFIYEIQSKQKTADIENDKK